MRVDEVPDALLGAEKGGEMFLEALNLGVGRRKGLGAVEVVGGGRVWNGRTTARVLALKWGEEEELS